MEFVFETMKKENMDECANLILSSMRKQLTSVHRNRDTIKQMLSRSQTTALIAKKKRKIVGLVGGTAPNVNFVAVLDEESASKGLGYLLLNKYEKLVKQKLPRATHLKASLFAGQSDAVALYSRLGFVVDGFVRDFVMGRDMVFMRRHFRQTCKE